MQTLSGGLRVPLATKLGAATILFGLLYDLSEHSFVSHVNELIVAGFPLGEHAAHLVVICGMVLALAGVIADGVRTARRLDRQNRSPGNALR